MTWTLLLQDLLCLFDTYLTPLQSETFLSQDEVTSGTFGRSRWCSGSLTSLPQMEALFGSLPDMLDFQRVFLQTLEDRIQACPNFSGLDSPGQFQVSVLTAGGFPPLLLLMKAVFEEPPLLVGRIFPRLRRPLQALRPLLRHPQQSPEGPGER